MNGGLNKVLLVDDDRASLAVLQRVVEGMGLEVRTAPGRAEAREALRREDFGAMVSDVGMETPDAGVLLAQEAGILRPGLRVVLITGEPQMETALPALRFHAFDYLAKPYALDDLRRSVRRALAARSGAESGSGRLREELGAAYSELKKIERTREGMLAVLNHELRTPLCVIRAAAEEIAAEECSPTGTTTRRLLGDGIARLEKAVSDLLLHARLAGGERIGRMGPVRLSVLAEETAADLAAEAAVRGIRIELTREDGNGPAPGDGLLLGRAVGHLMANAVRFNRPGGLVRVRCGGDAEIREIRVEDEGGGLPAGEMERIFDPFYQVADFMTRRTGGLGLGLAIVREVFEGHGGGVTAVNLPGRGCEFRAWIPARAPASKE
ncbi:MAG: response regulator [Elusimicrobia bacterium]|nr:response regulator [Elusimicrobiota bacterium]MDE2511578.1 response regulator [Elusimicrobiota bacterium]